MRFLKRLAAEEPKLFGGGFLSSADYKGSYPKVLNVNKRQIIEAIVEAGPYLSPAEQKLADLYLEYPPRIIAKKMGIPVSILYDRLRFLRRNALAIVAKLKDSLINRREYTPPDERLECHPSQIALRTVALTLNEKTKFCYLVERDSFATWVDEEGQTLPAAVADVLNNIADDAKDFEFLDVVADGA